MVRICPLAPNWKILTFHFVYHSILCRNLLSVIRWDWPWPYCKQQDCTHVFYNQIFLQHTVFCKNLLLSSFIETKLYSTYLISYPCNFWGSCIFPRDYSTTTVVPWSFFFFHFLLWFYFWGLFESKFGMETLVSVCGMCLLCLYIKLLL